MSEQCGCVPYTIRTDYGTGTEHDVDCSVHGVADDPLDVAIQYAGAYWTHGHEPQTQAALTRLAQAVESMREFMRSRTLDGEFTELERWEEHLARRDADNEKAHRLLSEMPYQRTRWGAIWKGSMKALNFVESKTKPELNLLVSRHFLSEITPGCTYNADALFDMVLKDKAHGEVEGRVFGDEIHQALSQPEEPRT
jgi:hypothetical protein